MRRQILLLGGHGKTRSLATSLISKGYEVIAVSDVPEVALDLSKVEGLEVISGSPCETSVLDQAGAPSCDVAVALSNSDAQNLISLELCKQQFGVPRTVSVLSDARKVDFFHRMGVDVAVSVSNIITMVIEQQTITDDLESIIPIENGQVEIVETQVSPSSRMVGRRLRDLDFSENEIVGCLLRGAKTIVPNGATRIAAGDRLVLLRGHDLESSGDADEGDAQ